MAEAAMLAAPPASPSELRNDAATQKYITVVKLLFHYLLLDHKIKHWQKGGGTIANINKEECKGE